jgi:hypothetical protein
MSRKAWAKQFFFKEKIQYSVFYQKKKILVMFSQSEKKPLKCD